MDLFNECPTIANGRFLGRKEIYLNLKNNKQKVFKNNNFENCSEDLPPITPGKMSHTDCHITLAQQLRTRGACNPVLFLLSNRTLNSNYQLCTSLSRIKEFLQSQVSPCDLLILANERKYNCYMQFRKWLVKRTWPSNVDPFFELFVYFDILFQDADKMAGDLGNLIDLCDNLEDANLVIG